MRHTIPLLMLIVLCSPAFAQKGTIKGMLKDSATKEALSLATVTVFKASDTSIITYRLSDQQGVFAVPSLPLDLMCRVVISFQGYKVYRKEFQLTKEKPILELGSVFMPSNSTSLDEVLVVAERPPVVMRKDTIEFNASAFKTLPSALVEDLMKKLPGVDIDTEGNITVNGRRVNRLLVDGKEFFGGDPKIATRNLPANIVDKIQVTDDKEELDKDPNIAKSDLGQIVNIKLKRSIKQGWFGKAYAGGGTDSRHEAGAIVNIFRDTTQVSVLGYSNNINKPGFGITDVQRIGGFNRSGTNSMMFTSDGGYALNGVSFGGTGQGLQRSVGGGVNFNNQWGKKVTLNLQYFYGQINSDYTTLNNTRRTLNDTTQYSSGSTTSSSVSNNHRIGGTVNWKIDSLTTMIIRGGVTLGDNHYDTRSAYSTRDDFKGPLNNNNNNSNSDGTSKNYSGSINLSRSFKKKGRFLNVNTDISSGLNDNEQYTNNKNSFYIAGQPKDSLINQFRKTNGNNTRAYLSASFSEPIGEKFNARFSQTAEYVKQENINDFFILDTISGKYSYYSLPLSNGYDKRGWRTNSSAEISYREKKITITPGVNIFNLDLNNDFVKSPSVSQRISNIFPYLNLRLGIFNVNYRVNTQEPRAEDLQQVIDISNPLYQQFGNPSLKPTISHNVSVNAYYYNPKAGSSFSVYISGNFSNNSIIRSTTMDSKGVQTSKPINVDGVKSFFGSASYNYQYKVNKNFRLSLRPGLSGNYNRGLVAVNNIRSQYTNVYATGSMGIGLNYNDKIEFNQRYSLTQRLSNYENKTSYKDVDVVSHSSESEIVLRWPKHIVWESQLNYNYNPQISAGLQKSTVRMNAGVNFLFLKEDKGQLKLSVFDLFKQNVSVNTYANENYVSDVQTTTLTRYFMLSFIYNIRTFSGGKVGGKERSFMLF
jgi:hypothetical protein